MADGVLSWRREEEPHTPKGLGGGMEAFSFPVTPTSEPAPPPTAVFTGWSSFKQSLRSRPRDGGLEGGSECTTDDEGASDTAQWSTLSNKSSTAGTCP